MDDSILIGKSDKEVKLLLNKANRHGLISGATGTGKTVSLKVLAEKFSDENIPVFLVDIKGDLASLTFEGVNDEAISKRLNKLNIADYDFKGYPVELWDLYGEKGIPMRTTISMMGPLLLAKALNLNDVQSGVLDIAFRVADDEGLLLIDLKDLRLMLTYLGENAKELRLKYGNITSQSIGAILRSILRLEDNNAELFFGEVAININDILLSKNNQGIINILDAHKLIHRPDLYASFLLWMLAELYENLDEIGDSTKPKLVFFFEEAHLIFNNASKALMEKIEEIVRLSRSKGIAIFFITQNPTDIPDNILNQLGNKIFHALRAYSEKDQKAIKAIAKTLRLNPKLNIEEELTNLKTGEALISFLQDDGSPMMVEKALILPPRSFIGTIDEATRAKIINNSPLYPKYKDYIDRKSAYEILSARQQLLDEAKKIEAEAKTNKVKQKELAKLKKNNPLNKIFKTTVNTFTGDIGRKIARGVLKTITKNLK